MICPRVSWPINRVIQRASASSDSRLRRLGFHVEWNAKSDGARRSPRRARVHGSALICSLITPPNAWPRSWFTWWTETSPPGPFAQDDLVVLGLLDVAVGEPEAEDAESTHFSEALRSRWRRRATGPTRVSSFGLAARVRLASDEKRAVCIVVTDLEIVVEGEAEMNAVELEVGAPRRTRIDSTDVSPRSIRKSRTCRTMSVSNPSSVRSAPATGSELTSATDLELVPTLHAIDARLQVELRLRLGGPDGLSSLARLGSGTGARAPRGAESPPPKYDLLDTRAAATALRDLARTSSRLGGPSSERSVPGFDRCSESRAPEEPAVCWSRRGSSLRARRVRSACLNLPRQHRDRGQVLDDRERARQLAFDSRVRGRFRGSSPRVGVRRNGLPSVRSSAEPARLVASRLAAGRRPGSSFFSSALVRADRGRSAAVELTPAAVSTCDLFTGAVRSSRFR